MQRHNMTSRHHFVSEFANRCHAELQELVSLCADKYGVFAADGENIIENNIGAAAAVEAGGIELSGLWSLCVYFFTYSQDVWIEIPVQPGC